MNNQPAPTRSPLMWRQIEMMLTVLIRDPGLFNLARKQLTVPDFPQRHASFAVIWAIACDHYDLYNELPNEEHFATELEARADRDAEFSDGDLEKADEFLKYAFRSDQEIVKDFQRQANHYFKMYLEDRQFENLRATLSTGRIPVNTAQELQQIAEQATRIQTIEPKPIAAPYPEGWNDDNSLQVVKIPMKMPIFNDFTQGGLGRGEVLGLLGPHGSCKTTLAIQLSTGVAVAASKKWRKSEGRGKLWLSYHFFWEGSTSEMRLRGLSCEGRLHRDTLETGDPNAFSRGRRLKPYEKRLYRTQLAEGAPVQAEYDRFLTAQELLNQTWRHIDMTGNDRENPGRGWGLVDEMAALLRADLDLYDRNGIDAGIDVVTMDYAGAAVRRYLEANNMEPDRNMRHVLTTLPYKLQTQIAEQFNCGVIALHQLSGSANAIKPGRTAHGTDAAENKSWRENLDFNVVVGALDMDGRFLLSLDKHRRTPWAPERIGQLFGHISRVVDSSDTHMVDHGKIVPKEDRVRIKDTDAYDEEVPSHSKQSADDEQIDAITMEYKPTNV